MRIKLSVSRQEQEQMLGSVLKELHEQERVQEGWRDTTLVCKDGRLVTNRLLLTLLLPPMEVGEQPVVLLPSHTVSEVLGSPGEQPPAPAPAYAPGYTSALAPAHASTPASIFSAAPNPVSVVIHTATPVHDFASGQPFDNILPGIKLSHLDSKNMEGLVSSRRREKANQEKHPKSLRKKTSISKSVHALALLKASAESIKGGVDDLLSKRLENFRFGGKDDPKSEDVVYGESDTDEEEEEKPKQKKRTNTQIKKSYICEFCTKASTTKSALKIHRMSHTGEKPFPCTFCENSFSTHSRQKIHQSSHTGEMAVFCEDCGSRNRNSYALKRHMKRVHGKNMSDRRKKTYVCTLCNESFPKSSRLQIHMISHTGVNPFACTHCRLDFSRADALKIHKMSHTGEKPFACNHCDKAFRRSNHLKRHNLTHTKATVCLVTTPDDLLTHNNSQTALK